MLSWNDTEYNTCVTQKWNGRKSYVTSGYEKLLGERMLSKQEMSHLSMSLPMVSCTNHFVRVNINFFKRDLMLKKLMTEQSDLQTNP